MTFGGAARRPAPEPAIVHLCEGFGGGVLTVLQALADHTAGLGIPTTVLHGRRPQTPADVRALFDERVRLIEVPGWGARTLPGEAAATLSALTSFRRELASRGGGVAHLHSTFAGLVGRLAGPLPRWRLFYTPQAYVFLNSSVPRPLRAAGWAAEAILSRRGMTLASSTHEGELAAAFTGGRRVAVVQNGVDLPAQPLPPPVGDRFVVAVVGRAVYQRRPDLVARAARALRQDVDAEFVWIGDGPGREELESAGVEVRGWMPREEAVRALAAAHVVLHLSAFEGLPLALLEVMASGRTVVASDIPPIREAVGDAGLLVGDADEAVSALRLLHGDSELRTQLAAQGRERVARLFTRKAMVERIVAAYGLD